MYVHLRMYMLGQSLNYGDAQQYGISAIPQNLLIDPQGKIVAKNIRSEELNKKLEEIIKYNFSHK